MIVILKINSADIINEIQSDTLALCLIPSNSIKYKLSQLPIMKELINQLVDVIEEPEPIDPDDYIFIDDVPEFFWKVIQYVLTKPDRISATSWNNLQQLFQLNSGTIFNWATNGKALVNYDKDYNIRPIVDGTWEGYTFGTAYAGVTSDNKFDMQSNFLTIETICYLQYINQVQSITIFTPTDNPLHPNKWVRLIKTGYKNFQIAFRTSTVSGYNYALNLELDYLNGDATSMPYNAITLTAGVKPSDPVAFATLKAEYYLTKNGSETRTQSIIGSGNLKALPGDVQERIGGYRQSKPTGAGLTNVPAVSIIRRYKSTIQNITTKKSEVITYIDYDKSKSIDEKLLVIV